VWVGDIGGGVGVGVVVHCLVTALSAHKIVVVESLWESCTYQDIYTVVVVNLLF
jgi:hypothetical protein